MAPCSAYVCIVVSLHLLVLWHLHHNDYKRFTCRACGMPTDEGLTSEKAYSTPFLD